MATWSGPDDHDPREPRAGEPRTYVTGVCCPPAGSGVQRLHSSMTEPGPGEALRAASSASPGPEAGQ
jgi:hypothetical protein